MVLLKLLLAIIGVAAPAGGVVRAKAFTYPVNKVRSLKGRRG